MRVPSSSAPTGTPGPRLDLADDTWVAAPPAVVAAAVADPRRWRGWWPDLDLEVSRDRGVKGQQWLARPRPSAPARRWPRRPAVRWSGSLEIWLEPWSDGVLLHHYARLDPVGVAAVDALGTARERERRVLRWKRAVHALKDELELGSAATRPEQGAQGP